MSRTVTFFKTSSGKCPVQDFLDSLPGKVAQKVVWVLRLLEDLDIIPITYFKKLSGTEDIWECRIQFGSDIYRVFCFFDSHSTVVLTHGFKKKSMKTPRLEIQRAESYKRDYFNRKRAII
jgi:phage-related protein